MRRIVASMAMLLLVTSVWAGTLKHDFEDGNLNGWRRTKWFDKKTEWSIENGELVAVSKDICAEEGGLIIGDETWENYEFEVPFKLVETFGSCGPGSFVPAVSIGIATDEAIHDSAFISIWTQDNVTWGWAACSRFDKNNWNLVGNIRWISIEEGQWYTMRVAPIENGFEMFVNDQAFRVIGAPVTEGGGAVLRVVNSEVRFDNIRITGDDIPDAPASDAAASVSEKGKLVATWGRIKNSRMITWTKGE